VCGRFSLAADPSTIRELFGLYRLPPVTPRFNIAPTMNVPVVLETDAGRAVEMMRWGLIPSWAKDKKIGNRMINARGETAPVKPAFRSAFKRRRGLVIADGFYEWVKDGKRRLPYRIHMADGSPFAMAGLWERWNEPHTGELILSTTIITTTAGPRVSAVHDRAPVILRPEDYASWLNPRHQDVDGLRRLIAPREDPRLVLHTVSTYVNNVRHRGEGCWDPPDTTDP